MKKGMICFVIAILLAFFTAGPVFATFSAFSQFDSSSSPQLALAMLQMELAKANKEQALSGIKEIEKQQAEKKEAADFLAAARECRAAAASTGGETEMPADMAAYMDARGLAYGGDLRLTAKEWDTAIASLEYHMNNVGLDIQQQMVKLQDFMGQYNSYMQGANSAISQSNQILSGLAKGQSMYGDSEVGLAVTGLVVGLVLGCLVTLAVQKSRGKKVKA